MGLVRTLAVVLLAVFSVSLVACRAAKERTRAGPEAPASVTKAPDTSAPAKPLPRASSPKKEPAAPATVERIRVPGDAHASIVRSTDGKPPVTVFVPGLCSNAYAYLLGFPEAARREGGIVAIDGDQPCGVDGFRSFSWDASKLHSRVEAALAAAGLEAIPREGITFVGYSQGAALAELLVQKWPERYARVVLIGAPVDPSPQRLDKARAVVTMSCNRDVPARMKEAARRLDKAGVPATYLEMPGCTHGNIADGDRVFDETFTFLRTRARPPADMAEPVPLHGLVR